MSSLYNNAVKQSNILKKQLEELRAAPETAPNRLIGAVSSSITTFQRAVESYNGTIPNELVPEKKEKGQVRVQKFRDELIAAREELRQLKAIREESQASASRAELFQDLSGSTLSQRSMAQAGVQSSGLSENPFARGPDIQDQGIDRATGIAREGDVLARASQSIDEFIEMGRHAFSDLSEQNNMLRQAGQSMRKVANTLGISNQTIRKIERRAKEDKYIFYAGVLLLLVSFYFIVKWLK